MKLLWYKTLIKPIWTYMVFNYGVMSKSQNKYRLTLRKITNSPPYVSTHTLTRIFVKKPLQQEI